MSSSSSKRDRLWESSRKELKYLETQTDLLVASLSALASSRQTQTLAMVSKKFMATDRAEYEVFTQSNNCEQILNRMKNTLGTIERELVAFKTCTERDPLINEAVGKCVEGILNNCKMHVKSCQEALKSIAEDPLLSETMAKSLLSLVIHRPLLFSNHKSLFPDIESLLLIK